MKHTDNALNILTAQSYKRIGNAWIVQNLKGNESVETIVSLLKKKGVRTNEDEFETFKSKLKKELLENFDNDCCDGIVALGDEDFPRHRGNVKNNSEKPVLLYYKGNIDLLSLDNENIAVIGLLNPDGNIEVRERKIVAEFVKNGATIVSGLAFGCDSIAHQQALDSNGKTVAILPSPLNNIMPAKNKYLAHQIVEQGGLLVTEYGKDFKSQKELIGRYEKRDRLQALFCDAIVLTASYAKNSVEQPNMLGQKLDSGARLAMKYAKEYGIHRAVMYDEKLDKENPMFDLNRALIAEKEEITIITQDNVCESVKKILGKKKTTKSEAIVHQGNLFDNQ